MVTCYGYNLLHRLRRERESVHEGLYSYRHSVGRLRRRLARVFGRAAARPLVGLPDWLPSPTLDWALSRVPGWSLLGRTVVGWAVRH